jgi:hypothetical protein
MATARVKHREALEEYHEVLLDLHAFCQREGMIFAEVMQELILRFLHDHHAPEEIAHRVLSLEPSERPKTKK